MTGWWTRRMRATAYGVPINTRDGLAPQASRRKASRPGREGGCTAAHSKAPPLTPAHCTLHTAQRTTPTTANLRLLHGPGSAAHPSCTPHYCCKPPLLKVRLSIRGALNPYVLPPPAPDTMPRCTAPRPPSPHGPDCLAAAG